MTFKKMVAMCLVCLIICTGANCGSSAETSDFATMGTDELLKLHAQIDKELQSRVRCEASTIPAGVYKVGQDIKAGIYLFGFYKQYNNDDRPSVQYAYYLTEEDWKKSDEYDWGHISPGVDVRINLVDGMVLNIVFGVLTIQELDKTFWAP